VEALFTLIPLFVTLSACGNSAPMIPNGAYMTADMKEAITVEGPRIHFKVIAGEDGTRMIDRSCEYSVWPDGRLQPLPLSSQEVLTGIGKFDWRWDGLAIVQSDPRAPDRPAKVFEYRKDIAHSAERAALDDTKDD
jgi:hypothetical protein